MRNETEVTVALLVGEEEEGATGAVLGGEKRREWLEPDQRKRRRR